AAPLSLHAALPISSVYIRGSKGRHPRFWGGNTFRETPLHLFQVLPGRGCKPQYFRIGHRTVPLQRDHHPTRRQTMGGKRGGKGKYFLVYTSDQKKVADSMPDSNHSVMSTL